MAYQPPSRADFDRAAASYLPHSDFSFYLEPSIPFLPPPSIVNQYQAIWDTGSAIEKIQQTGIVQASHRSVDLSIDQKNAQQKQHNSQLSWGILLYRQVAVAAAFEPADSCQNSNTNQWQQLKARNHDEELPWDQSLTRNDRSQGQQWQQAPAQDKLQAEHFHRVDEFTAETSEEQQGYQPPYSALLDFYVSTYRYSPLLTPAVYFRFITKPDHQAIRPKDSIVFQRFSSHQIQDQPIKIPWGLGHKLADEHITSEYGGETEPQPEKPEPQQPDIRDTYLFMNTVTVVTMPDRIPVEFNQVEINLDIDSFSWRFDGELWGASSLSLIEPDKESPKQIEVNINGWRWVFMIERYQCNRQFAKEQYKVSGTSRTQLLAQPYAPKRSKSSSSAINARQAITEELMNTGFSAHYPAESTYETPDWIIPGGTFSYQSKAPMDILANIATTVGSVVIPARHEDMVNIQPRYSANPWSWDTAIMDNIIPASMVISLSASWRPEPEYNAVYVSGIHAGVAIDAQRSGTAGNNPAPDIIEEWLTETQANTERARNELCKGGPQSITTLELPLTDTATAPGLIEPGKLIEVQDTLTSDNDWRGLCISCYIKASRSGHVVQQITLERHH